MVKTSEVSNAHTAQSSACVNEVAAESATCDKGVDGSLAINNPLSYKGVHGHMNSPADIAGQDDITKYWEGST